MLEDKIFKTQVSACSGSPSKAMLWIKEVEMVDAVDDIKSSHSIQGHTHFPNFEMLDARTESALNKIIQNSYFEKKGQSGACVGDIGRSDARKLRHEEQNSLPLASMDCWLFAGGDDGEHTK